MFTFTFTLQCKDTALFWLTPGGVKRQKIIFLEEQFSHFSLSLLLIYVVKCLDPYVKHTVNFLLCHMRNSQSFTLEKCSGRNHPQSLILVLTPFNPCCLPSTVVSHYISSTFSVPATSSSPSPL